jgi:hypothetical protein
VLRSTAITDHVASCGSSAPTNSASAKAFFVRSSFPRFHHDSMGYGAAIATLFGNIRLYLVPNRGLPANQSNLNGRNSVTIF